MADGSNQPVILDTTVLSNFASTQSTDHLVEILAQPMIVLAVKAELEEGRDRGYAFLDDIHAHIGGSIELLSETNRPHASTLPMLDHLDAGEADSLAIAVEYDGILATDDFAARRLAAEYNVPVTGSIGILVSGIRRGIIDADTANQWLTIWREQRGYYAPVDRIRRCLSNRSQLSSATTDYGHPDR